MAFRVFSMQEAFSSELTSIYTCPQNTISKIRIRHIKTPTRQGEVVPTYAFINVGGHEINFSIVRVDGGIAISDGASNPSTSNPLNNYRSGVYETEHILCAGDTITASHTGASTTRSVIRLLIMEEDLD